MPGETSERLDAILYMNMVTNPLCTVPEITKCLTGRWTDSNDSDYVKTYRMLEAMTNDKLLYKISTKNGGNVYISRARVLSPVSYPHDTQGTVDEFPY